VEGGRRKSFCGWWRDGGVDEYSKKKRKVKKEGGEEEEVTLNFQTFPRVRLDIQ